MSEVDSIINFGTSVEDAEAPAPLPKNRYTATIRRATAKMSQNNTKYAELLFHIGPDQYPADYTEGNPEGTSIAYRRVGLEDNPQARWRLKNFCLAIGAPIPSTTLNVADWVGLTADVEVGHETYEGVERAIITRVFQS